MKKLVFGLFLTTSLFTSVQAQVKIGENPENLHFNSVLELESTNKALVITRMSTIQMNAITPLNGAIIYNTDTKCLHYYNNTEWINLCEAENAGNINLVDNGDDTYTFTNAAGNDITFETPAFTNNHTGSGGVGFPSGIKVTDNGNTVNIEVEQIHGNSILNKTIGRTKIALDAIGVDELGDTSVDTNNLIDGAVTTTKIMPGTNNQVLKTVGSNVEWGTLDATSIAGQDLTAGASITLTGTPTGSLLETVGISVADGGITNAKLAADAISTDKIADETILSEDILDGTIATLDIANDAVTAVKINADVAGTGLTKNATTGTLDVDVAALTGDGNITSTDLNVGGDTNALLGDVTLEINPSAVGANELADEAVTTTKIVDANVTTSKIADDAIDNTKLADAAVQTENILDGTIATLDIADNAITAIKINADVAGTGLTKNATTGALDVDVAALTGDGNITSTDLSVTGGTNATLNDVALEINPSAVGANELADGAVTTTKIVDANVTTSKIANGTANQVLKTNNAGDGVEWGTLDATSITGQDLTVDTSLEFTGSTTGVGALLETVSISVADSGITNTKLNADAVTTDKIANETILSEDILDGTILNTDINSAAAIDGSKISPVFTSNVSTTGTLTTTGNATIGANTITNIDGTDGQVLTTDGAGAATWKNPTTGIPTSTPGAIFFSDGAGNLAENNSQLFWDNTNNRLGIGRANPQDKLDVEGQIRARNGFAATAGTVGQPSYGFYTNGDTNTGMFRIAEDQIGFSVGGIEALNIDETSSNTTVTVREKLKLDGTIEDINNSVGTTGQVLTSTATGTQWKAPAVIAMGKVLAAGGGNENGATTTKSSLGNYTVTFTSPMPDADYIIQLTLLNAGADVSIEVVNQTTTGFEVQISQMIVTSTADTSSPPTITSVISSNPIDGDWFFTVTDF